MYRTLYTAALLTVVLSPLVLSGEDSAAAVMVALREAIVVAPPDESVASDRGRKDGTLAGKPCQTL